MSDPREMYTEFDFDIWGAEYDVPITIDLLGCVHYGTDMCCTKTLDRWCKERKPKYEAGNHYAVLLGDILDDYRYTDQTRIATLRASGMKIDRISDFVRQEVDETAKKLEFLKRRVIISVEGNHGYVFPNTNTTADEYLCQQLKCKWGGAVSYNTIRIHIKRKHIDINLFAFHGRQATMLLGSNLNEPERIIPKFDAQLIFAAHAHQSVGGKRSRISRKYGELGKAPEIVLLRAGSFKRNFVPGTGDYATSRPLNPAVLAVPYATIIPRKRDGGYLELAYHG